MDATAQVLETAHTLYARAESDSTETEARPPVYKAVGIALAVASGCFIGVSFVLKKVGLLKANDKYNEIAGEGYGYLKNFHWWGGMTLMIIGEICNFAAYAFTDAILVTSLGALSVVITTILSAIFLKERLSMVGKVACFLCVIGTVVIVMNAPTESAVANIEEMQSYVVTPGFLTYAGIIIVGSAFVALWVGPRYGKKNMFPYISVCSWIGGLSVVATQGLGAAIVAQAGGTPQFNHWFLYVVLVFVIATLLTEIIYLNKALNLFNAAMVTPTYYVYFTSTTIITSSVLFQGFRGTATQIVTVVMGFLTICAGVVLLQLSKSAKDVPDTAIFTGDLDQIHMIADQEQPETEPKADAIRGTAAIMRRISNARQKMEEQEFRRLHEEKERERLAPLSEDGREEFEWDGLRRRRTVTMAGLEKTEYAGAAGHISDGSSERHIQIADLPPPPKSSGSLAPPTPPPHGDKSMARRQFSFQNVFRRHHPDSQQQQQEDQDQDQSHLLHQHQHQHQHQRQSSSSTAAARLGLRSRGYSDRQVPRGDSATEEERLGLVKGDSQSMPALPRYDGFDDGESSEGEETTSSSDVPTEDSDEYAENKHAHFGGGRELTDHPPGPGRGHDPSPGDGSGNGGSRGGGGGVSGVRV
ncbi:putative duf803 domain membrane protein [Eutypa lata UCREL1]|uniref:Putative duf803 domain membrane protein n=1 Tax=Eutypa lata (strain UCR-EL1) TaxID=1287681 RepID=M7T2Y7_EUTLA|nr:putative duf803 domain membrane protein [Eutypa lata UCREL1]